MQTHHSEITAERVSTPKLVLGAAIAMAALLGALLYIRYALAITFQAYDDEGYLLLSFGHYFKGGALYTAVYSDYGPFYYYAQGALFRLLHLPVDHDAGRLVTLIWWFLSAVLGGYFVYQISKDIVLASAALLACVKLMSPLANEPGHPQQVILPLLMLACCASVPRQRLGFRLVLLGALGTALIFTKINVGLFYFAALACLLICSFPPSHVRTFWVGLLLAYAVASPVLLMRRNLAGWALGYCVVAVLCSFSTFLTGSFLMPPSPHPMRSVYHAFAGVVLTAVLIVGGTMLQGMSLRTLLDGVLWAALKHPGVFYRPLPVSEGKLLSAVLATGSVGLLYFFRDRIQARADLIDAFRCFIGLCAIPLVAFSIGRIIWFLPFLPLGLLPVKSHWRTDNFIPRLFVTSLAATQFLQAYPVNGSQLAIGAAPFLLWAFICVHDGADGLLRSLRRMTQWSWGGSLSESLLAGVLLVGLVIAMSYSETWSKRHAYSPSRLHGSASLHLPAQEEDRYLFLANTIRANCDVLFTLPGMGSLNYWSGVPTPNGSNLNAWMRLFRPERQQQILDILKKTPRSCAVYNPTLVTFWQVTPEEMRALPLAHYVTTEMRTIAEKDGYEIRVHPRRDTPVRLPALGTAER
jgi:hypothetical protein